jgi:holo-[acyl-carrier protein] synthase
MIQGIGSDIIEIDRIRKVFLRHGDSFLHKILTPHEASYISSMHDPAPSLAGRFCAKEAVAKALGTGFGQYLDFHDIEILNNAKGKPIIYLSARSGLHFGHPKLHLTISHCKSYAIAVCYNEKD